MDVTGSSDMVDGGVLHTRSTLSWRSNNTEVCGLWMSPDPAIWLMAVFYIQDPLCVAGLTSANPLGGLWCRRWRCRTAPSPSWSTWRACCWACPLWMWRTACTSWTPPPPCGIAPRSDLYLFVFYKLLSDVYFFFKYILLSQWEFLPMGKSGRFFP